MTSLAKIVAMHGLGGRADLPAPGWLVTYAAVVVVLLSFFAMVALSTDARFERPASRTTSIPATRWLTGRGMRRVARSLALAVFVAFLTVAWFGVDDQGARNPAPTWFYVWFWVGLVPVSVLLGPVWASINPLRTLAGAANAALRCRHRTLPAKLGYLPAVAGLMSFLWLELVYDDAASARVVASYVTLYAVIQIGAGMVFGPEWFSRCEAFEVYATMLARIAPVASAPEGHVVLRRPLQNLASTPALPDLTPVVVVILGATAFDGVSRTAWWSVLTAGTTRRGYLVLGTSGLLACIATVAVTYGLAVLLMRPFQTEPLQRVAPHFAHAVIPIAIGYTVAHYFSFAVLQGQQGVILGSDPLQRGWDILGLSGAAVNYSWPSITTIAVVQVSSIVVGHVLAVVVAHDRAIRLLRPSVVVLGQAAMVGVMALYTGVGIGLVAA